MTRLMLARAGASGSVLAFEPLPVQAATLREEFASAPVHLAEKCLSRTPRESTTFYHARDRRWVSSLSSDGLEGYDVEELTVPVTSIDTELAERNLPVQGSRVRFIKLDIEGAEFDAIRGARRTLQSHKPLVVFENSLAGAAQRYGYTDREFFAFFDEIGYRLFDIFGAPVTPAVWAGPSSNVAWNFVAVGRTDMPSLEAWCLAEARQVVLELADDRTVALAQADAGPAT